LPSSVCPRKPSTSPPHGPPVGVATGLVVKLPVTVTRAITSSSPTSTSSQVTSAPSPYDPSGVNVNVEVVVPPLETPGMVPAAVLTNHSPSRKTVSLNVTTIGVLGPTNLAPS